MKRSWRYVAVMRCFHRHVGILAAAVALVQLVLHASPAIAQQGSSPGGVHAEGYCAMYGICAKRSDGMVLNCVNATQSVKPDDLFSSKIQSLCPTMTGNVCCTADQFDTLRTQVQQAVPFLVGCPACLRNFLNLFCELSCSLNQSLFINVTSVKQLNSSMTVDAIDFFVTPEFGRELYDSCKDVKFGTMNTRSMEFIGAGAHNYTEWFAFLGRQAKLNELGSPYAINFRATDSGSTEMKPLNTTMHSCADSSLGCSCGDCPSSSLCEGSSPIQSPSAKTCSVRIGSLKVKCLDFSLVIVFIVFLCGFLMWAILSRNQERTNPVKNGQDHDSIHKEVANVVNISSNKLQASIVQTYLSNFFRNYGLFVAKRPMLVLFVSLAIPVLLCIGLIRFSVETRPEKLWVSPSSKALEEKQYFDTHLSPFYRIQQLILATVPSSKDSPAPGIVTDGNIKLLFDIQKKVDDLRANYSGRVVSLTDICLKPLGSDCGTQSVLQYFKMDSKNYDDYGGVDHATFCFQHYSSEETCLSAFQAPMDPSVVLGGFSGSNYSEATAFVISYPVNNHVDITGQENGMAIAWEKSFINLAKEDVLPMARSQNLTLAFSSESSIQEELKRESTADAITILISYLVMFAYISFTLGDRPSHISHLFISTKVLLGLSGVVLVMISVLGSIGFFSAIGVKSTLIILEVIPFLVLAVGVDNMCILVHAVKRQPLGLSLEERVSNALAEVGPSITLASVSEVLAFGVSAIAPLPACRVFSMNAALAVLFDFILQVTAFVALIVLDFRRTEDGRADCVPCLKLASSAEAEGGSGHGKLNFLAWYMKDIHAPILGHKGVKVIVVAVFVGFAFASIALCSRLQPGLEQQIVLPRDSYLQDYFDNLAKYLRVGPPLYFVLKDFNYSTESDNTNKVCSINNCDSGSLSSEISKASLTPQTSYIAKPAASWLDDFLVWMSPDAFGCCRKFTNNSYCPPDDQPPCCAPRQGSCGLSPECRDCTTCFRYSDLHDGRPSTTQFRDKLPWFLNALPSSDCAKGGKGAYTTNLNLDGFESGTIQSSAFRTYHTPLNKQSDYINSMRAVRDFSTKISESLQLKVFPYSVFYIFFEQYLDIGRTAAINICIGLAAVYVACFIFTASFWTSTIILIVLAMIVLDIMGVMVIMGVQLNALSVVNLVMSVGIAVEFCVHITHAFTVSIGNRDERARQALTTMGSSVFSGITLTKLVGVVVLRFAKSEVFVVYYFQMFLALVLIGFLHGLIFLPVVLSICGPASPNPKADSQQELQQSTQQN